MVNDCPGAPVVRSDILQNFAQLGRVDVADVKHTLGGMGIGEDRRHGLLHLMGQRRRQLTHQSHASQVGKLAALLRRTRFTLPKSILGPAQLTTLEEQRSDQGRL